MKKDNLLVILGVVAVLAIVGLVLLFKMAMTGQGVYAQAGEDIYGPGTPMYSDNCDQYGPNFVFTQNPQAWRHDCFDGVRTIKQKRAMSWPYFDERAPNPKYTYIDGYCCPIGLAT